MVQLESYIKEQLEHQHSEQEIRVYLATQGYKRKAINKAFKNLSPKKNTTANDELVNYIVTYLRQGYTADNLFTSLLSQGYSKNQLTKAFTQANENYFGGQLQAKNFSVHKKKLHLTVLAVLLCCVVVLVLSGLYWQSQQNVVEENPISQQEVPENNFVENEQKMIITEPENNVPEEIIILPCGERATLSEQEACYLEEILAGNLTSCNYVQLPGSLQLCKELQVS